MNRIYISIDHKYMEEIKKQPRIIVYKMKCHNHLTNHITMISWYSSEKIKSLTDNP